MSVLNNHTFFFLIWRKRFVGQGISEASKYFFHTFIVHPIENDISCAMEIALAMMRVWQNFDWPYMHVCSAFEEISKYCNL